MADYYALLKKAVFSLPEPSETLRATIYEHARKALNAQLAKVTDPVLIKKGDGERQALENAIIRFEAEFIVLEAQKQHASLPEPPVLAQPAPPPHPPTVDIPAQNEPRDRAVRQMLDKPPDPPPSAKTTSDAPTQRQTAHLLAQNPPLSANFERPSRRQESGSGDNTRSGNQELTKQASLVRPDRPTLPASEPKITPAATVPVDVPAPSSLQQTRILPSRAPDVAQEQSGAALSAPVPFLRAEKTLSPPLAAEKEQSHPFFGHTHEPLRAQEGEPLLPPSTLQSSLQALSDPKPLDIKPIFSMHRPSASLFKRWRLIMLCILIALVMAGIGSLALILKQNNNDNDKFTHLAEQQQAEAQNIPPPKATARLGAPEQNPSGTALPPASANAQNGAGAGQAPTSSTAPATPGSEAKPTTTTSRAALLVEAQEEQGQIKVNLGTAVWYFAGNQLIAEVTLPDISVGVVMALRKNTDANLPASHILAVTFKNLAGSSFEAVRQIDHPLMRKEEAPAGDAWIGVVARITDNQFLFGLSSSPINVAHNLDLIKSRAWMDIPMRLASGKFAKLTLEKGAQGNAALNEALKSWDKPN